MQKNLHIVLGPTASGKTTFAIELAQQLNTEIVSADSRQIFKEMNIGVARPSKEELAMVNHHLIATWSIKENYNVARYEKEALEVINRLFNQHNDLVLCGGSGMYINAVINGIDDIPDTPADLRNNLNNELMQNGLEPLLMELKQKDEQYFAVVDKQNPRRIVRALEVIRLTGKPFSALRKNKNAQRNFNIKIIGINRNREDLIKRIDKRVDMMIEQGLVQEVQQLREFKSLPALSTVGYRELFEYFDGKCSLDEAVNLIKTHTRQYAKRQMTWFRKTPNVNWLSPYKKICSLVVFAVCFLSNMYCQKLEIDNDSNLIYNPSFELHSACPQRIDPYGIMSGVDAWWQPSHGSSDYYNNCGGKQCHVPKNKLGIQMPRTGGSMVGIYCSLTDYREYIQTELKQELIKDETYKLSFYVSLSEYSKGAVATIGGLFTSYRIADTTRQMLTDNQIKVLPSGIRQVVATFYKPQVVNSFSRPLYDTENWQKIEGTFVAKGGERFLTIGNFYPEEQSNHIDPRNTQNILPGAYYYIDDVELYCLTCTLANKDNNDTNDGNEMTYNKSVDTKEYSVGKTIVLENIFFDFDKSVILPQSYVELLNLTNLLNDNPQMKIELSGHTDNKGKDKYNEKLSEDRAKAVYEYLIKKGIDKKRMKYRGYGAKHPIADNKTEEGRAKNRRVEFTITEI